MAVYKRSSFCIRKFMTEAGRLKISTEYEKSVVSRRFDRGGHDGVPVETETKGKARLICTANCGHRFFFF